MQLLKIIACLIAIISRIKIIEKIIACLIGIISRIAITKIIACLIAIISRISIIQVVCPDVCSMHEQTSGHTDTQETKLII